MFLHWRSISSLNFGVNLSLCECSRVQMHSVLISVLAFISLSADLRCWILEALESPFTSYRVFISCKRVSSCSCRPSSLTISLCRPVWISFDNTRSLSIYLSYHCRCFFTGSRNSCIFTFVWASVSNRLLNASTIWLWANVSMSNFSCKSFIFFHVVTRISFSQSEDCRNFCRNRSISISAVSAAFALLLPLFPWPRLRLWVTGPRLSKGLWCEM